MSQSGRCGLLQVPGASGVLRILVLSAAVALAAGCASVKIGTGDSSEVAAAPVKVYQAAAKSERAILVDATYKIRQTPWPEVHEESLGDRMVGVLFGNGETNNKGVSQDQALEIYMRRLQLQPNPVRSLMRDADTSLSHARNLAETGRQAAHSIQPRAQDIDMLERAIGDIRECREMYLAAMKRMKNSGADITRQDMHELKQAFSQTIRDIGTTADLIHDHVAQARDTSHYAGTPPTQP